MADLKITELAEDVAPSSNDLFVTVNDSDGINRKVSIGSLVASIQNGGVNEISVAGLLGLLADDQHVLDAEVKLIKLDDLTIPDDNTDLNVSITAHGLCPKAPNDVTKVLKGLGVWDTLAVQVGFGAPVAKTIDTEYQAATDGILVAHVEEPTVGYGCKITVYSDAATPPTTDRGTVLAEYTNTTYTKYATISIPIRKSDYYKVVKGNFGLNNSANEVFIIYFYPLGS